MSVGRQRRAGDRQPDAVRAGRPGRVEEVHGVDAVTAAALGVVEHVVVERQAAEVVVLADLVRLVAELGDVERADGGGLARRLGRLGQAGRADDLGARAEHHAGRLRVGAVARVARGVDVVLAVDLRLDRGAAVVAAVGVGLGEGPLAVGGQRRHGPVVGGGDRVGRVDDAGGVGVGDVNRVRRGHVVDERQVLAVGRQVERALGLRGEAGHQVAARHLKRAQRQAPGSDLFQVEPGRDAEAAVDRVVVEHIGVVAARDGGHAGRAGPGRQDRLPGHDARVVDVVAGADQQVPGDERGVVTEPGALTTLACAPDPTALAASVPASAIAVTNTAMPVLRRMKSSLESAVAGPKAQGTSNLRRASVIHPQDERNVPLA